MKKPLGKPQTPKKNKREVEAERDIYAREMLAQTARFEEKVRELSTIRRIGETLRYVRDVRRVFGFILDIILEETNAETCSIMLYDHHRETLSVRAAKSQKNWTFDFYSDSAASGFGLKAGQGVAGRVVEEQKTIYISDIQKDGRYVAVAENRSKGSLLCLPLMIHNRVEGVVNLSHPKTHAFGDDVQRMIAIVMDQVALALNQVRVFDDLQQLNQSLENKVANATRHLQEVNAQLRQEIQGHERTELALKQAKEEAEQANRAKSEFLANMSHEIRTPLNAILGITQVLDETNLDQKQHEYLTMVKNSATALMGLLNGILDFSKIESGQYSLNMQPVDIDDLCHSVCSIFMVKATQKGIRLTFSPPNIPAMMWHTDANVLRQILINIVGNAVKFTNRGAVSLCYSQQDQVLLFAVSDTGPGISEADQKTVFDPFKQGDGSSVKHHEGTGLGLSISARLVALLGGEIWLDSAMSQGSTFYFSLPQVDKVGSVHTESETSFLSDVCDSRVVLLVEDNEINQLVAQTMLESRGHRVVIADCAEKGLALFKSQSFDVVLMDLQMPDIDGIVAAQTIRRFERENDRRQTPIIAVTAHAVQEYRTKCVNAGMNGFISKPFERDRFLALVEQQAKWGGNTPAAPGVLPAVIAPANKKKIFDRDRFLAQVSSNEALMKKMCAAFFNQRQVLQSDMQVALGAGDFSKLATLAHRLKGALATFYAEEAHAVALTLEKMALQADQPGIVAQMPVLWESLDRFYLALVAENVLEHK